MSQGQYIICPKCRSAKVELVLTGTKKKFNWATLWDKNEPMNKRVHEQKRHCLNCGYLW